jgi:hypothetical protein
MGQIVLIGLGAGAAAALLFASVISGSPFAILLAQLAPLPILIAALGWSHWAGLAAAAIAAAGVGSVLGLLLFPVFLIAVGVPAWWLGYLALLARPTHNGAAGGLEWYPVGRLLLWCALVASAVTSTILVASFGASKESFQTELRNIFEQFVQIQARRTGDGSAVARPETTRMIDLLVAAIPPAAAVLATLLNAFNLWLAGKVVAVSGRLRRPWPDLSGLTLPPFLPTLLAVAVAGSFLPGLLGLLSGMLAASLLMAYAIMGFAVLHAITRGIGSRAFALTATYVAVVLFGWPILAMSLLGLAEMAFNIRGRVAQKRGPPAPRI